jgi:3-deoxy-D-arabino-heptulosonate 7-phosphate (DAHP) synthase
VGAVAATAHRLPVVVEQSHKRGAQRLQRGMAEARCLAGLDPAQMPPKRSLSCSDHG